MFKKTNGAPLSEKSSLIRVSLEHFTIENVHILGGKQTESPEHCNSENALDLSVE